MDKVKFIEQQEIKKEMPKLNIGDSLKVWSKILEGDKVRLHPFEGTLIAINGSGFRTTFTVRKVSFGEGIERVFPLYSSTIDRIEIQKSEKQKRAKLYYLRGKVGKEARI